MTRILTIATVILAGSAAYGGISPALGPVAQVLPEPSTILICSLGMAMSTLFRRKPN